jgi:hypothetical protein
VSNEWNKNLEKKENLTVFYRFVKLECNHNLNLINCLKTGVDQQDPEIIEISNLIETAWLEIYFSEQIRNKSLVSRLKDKFIDNVDEETDDLVLNILLKIKIIKAINSLSFSDKSGYKKFRLKTRLGFLRNKLVALSIQLDEKINSL